MTDEAQAPEEETQSDADSGAEAPAEETNVEDEVNDPQDTEEG